MPRYTITSAATSIGLPKYAVGTWTHYNTHNGEWCLGQMTKSGRLAAHVRISSADAERMIAAGVMVSV